MSGNVTWKNKYKQKQRKNTKAKMYLNNFKRKIAQFGPKAHTVSNAMVGGSIQ